MMAERSMTPELRHNFRHLYFDIAWFGILSGTAMAFLGVYAARIGGSGFQLGLFTAGPAVVNLLFTLPAAQWLNGRPIVSTTFVSSVWYRLGYALMAVLPMLMVENTGQVWGLVMVTLAMSIPGTLLAIAFNAMFADMVPAEWRGEVVGRRNAIVAVVTTLATLGSGQILDRLVFPLNYQVVFALGTAGALMSSYHLSQLRGRQGMAANRPVALKAGVQTPRRSGLRFDVLRGPFGKFMAAYLVFYTCQHIPLPLFPLQMVKTLHLTDGQISLGSALFYMTMMLTSLRVGWISARYGHRAMLVTGGLLLGQYSLLLALARNATVYWIAALLGGAIWAVLNAGLVNRLMERVPDDDRPAHMAMHNLVLNLGMLAGAMSGSFLGDWMGLRQALGLGSLLRFLAGIVLWFAA